jgi:hypothetical protein
MNAEFINFLLTTFLVQIVAFVWYYLTLPGSYLSISLKPTKPRIRTALQQFIVHSLPIYAIVVLSYFSINHPIAGKVNCENAHKYLTSILNLCKK